MHQPLKAEHNMSMNIKFNKRFIFSILFCCFIFTSCSDPRHVEEAHRVINSFEEKMKKENLFMEGSGGSMMGDIQVIHLGFASYQSLNVNETRMLLVKGVETLLNQINTNQEIRPFLHDFPFTSNNIIFTITFHNKDSGDCVDPPYVAHVLLVDTKNKIIYFINDKETDRYQKIYEEPYGEALRIYNETLRTQSAPQ